MPRALFSLSDKTGAVPFARELERRGWDILSTGGTAAILREAGVHVTEVSTVTGHPEMLGGRVKTLHPAVHAGLLFRRDHEEDRRQLAEADYAPIDLLAVNLYPFRETVSRAGVSDAEAVEMIDIGGPAMLRAAAKNHADVWPIVDPADYDTVLRVLEEGEAAGRTLRRRLAARAFRHTSAYDAAVAQHFGAEDGAAPGVGDAGDTDLPSKIELGLRLASRLRYGENPHQRGGWYETRSEQIDERVVQMQGKALSYNNLLDLDAALFAVGGWGGEGVVCAVVKHGTPCGIAHAASAEEAYRNALATDPESAFGSIVAFNGRLTEGASRAIAEHFVEVVAAPAIDAAARKALADRKNLRLLEVDASVTMERPLEIRRIFAGFLAQDGLELDTAEEGWRISTSRAPSREEMDDLRFAWRAVASVKSNAILIAREGRALGIGGGQTSRVEAVRQAIGRARSRGFDLAGAVLASDAFFPFADGLEEAAAAGIRSVIQPGGSVRDEEVIAAANESDLAMILTGRRLFRH